ncbi:MAG TPA: PhzF family phenazine biosynthesis protein [Methylomirabilota bacterium]|nr:PhzF family phenazine biosynthesis protein [Methylomirabilota bacterium]
MSVPLLHVDSFASEPFRGNPAAVCLLPAPREPAWMQALAAELNLPATAFVSPAADGYGLRWFTALGELTLCGHGTLASAHALWETGRLAAGAAARFTTPAGALSAVRSGGWIEMDFPAEPPAEAKVPPGLAEALGAKPRWAGRNRHDVLVELDGEAAVRELAPNFRALREIETRGIIVTAPATSAGADFVSRFFAPRLGIREDAVTGSAHCCLGPFWTGRLSRASLVGRQLSARGGVVRVTVAGERVGLAGQAVTVARGELA